MVWETVGSSIIFHFMFYINLSRQRKWGTVFMIFGWWCLLQICRMYNIICVSVILALVYFIIRTNHRKINYGCRAWNQAVSLIRSMHCLLLPHVVVYFPFCRIPNQRVEIYLSMNFEIDSLQLSDTHKSAEFDYEMHKWCCLPVNLLKKK